MLRFQAKLRNVTNNDKTRDFVINYCELPLAPTRPSSQVGTVSTGRTPTMVRSPEKEMLKRQEKIEVWCGSAKTYHPRLLGEVVWRPRKGEQHSFARKRLVPYAAIENK